MIQPYALTFNSEDKEIELFYDNVREALQVQPTYYAILTSNFNAKLGK